MSQARRDTVIDTTVTRKVRERPRPHRQADARRRAVGVVGRQALGKCFWKHPSLSSFTYRTVRGGGQGGRWYASNCMNTTRVGDNWRDSFATKGQLVLSLALWFSSVLATQRPQKTRPGPGPPAGAAALLRKGPQGEERLGRGRAQLPARRCERKIRTRVRRGSPHARPSFCLSCTVPACARTPCNTIIGTFYIKKKLAHKISCTLHLFLSCHCDIRFLVSC